jgi:hypothetical protein
MKKIILILTVLFLLNACSKDDANTDTPVPEEEQGISAIKIYDGSSTTATTEIVTTPDYKIKYIAGINTQTLSRPATYFVYTGNLVTQYYYTLDNIKYTVDIEYYTNSKVNKVTSKKGSTTLSIVTYTYDNVIGKTTSQSLIYTNGVLSKTINAEYEYVNGNLVASTSNDGSTINVQTYKYDANTTNNKNVYSKIVGFDKLIFNFYYSNANPFISGVTTLQNASTLSLTEKRTYRQTITYNTDLYPSKIESFYTYNGNPETNSGYERMEYQ